jgi:hypothetical protein
LQSDGDVPYPLYDLTSSSLNQLHPRGTPTENRYRVKGTKTWHRENFGVIEIDWAAEDPRVMLTVYDIESAARIEKEVSLGELRVPDP